MVLQVHGRGPPWWQRGPAGGGLVVNQLLCKAGLVVTKASLGWFLILAFSGAAQSLGPPPGKQEGLW
jgi:hypothetical protein